MEASSDRACRPLRADAASNRSSIVDAARALFATRGVDVPLTAVAERAGVGIATLYRRFPDRDALLTAVFEERLAAHRAAAADALEDPDAWSGFCRYVERVCALQAADQGFNAVLTMRLPSSSGLTGARAEVFRQLAGLLDRAREAGRLRPDVTTEDFPLLLMANAGVVRGMGDAAPDAWRRVLGLLLTALDTRGEGPPWPLPPPVEPRRMVRAMARTRAAGNG